MKYKIPFFFGAVMLGVQIGLYITDVMGGTVALVGSLICLLVMIVMSILAQVEYNRLVLKTLCRDCDGETYVKRYKKLISHPPVKGALEVLILSNYAIALNESGDDEGKQQTMLEAVRKCEGLKKPTMQLRSLIYHNAASYLLDAGRVSEAKTYMEKHSALKSEVKPNHPAAWLSDIERQEKNLLMQFRTVEGDFGDDVIAYYLDGAENAPDNRTKVIHRSTLAELYEKRGETALAVQAYEQVIKSGNTLRIVREAREKLSALDAEKI